MGDYDSAKYWSKQGARRGLQKTRYYCQICQRQCKDANGFQSHNKSPSHLRKISQVTAEDARRYNIQFEKGFLQLLKQRHGEKWIDANKVYNEYVQDRDHIHMNATMHRSLTQFVRYLGRAGKVDVDMDIDDTSENVEGPLLIRIHPSSLSSPSEDGMLRSQQEEQEVIAAELLKRQLNRAKRQTEKVYQPEMKSEISGDSTLKRVQVTFHGNGRVNKKKKKVPPRKNGIKFR
ncbi:BCN_G0049590.mRNA.1.CDS.1 [Saccharomyces cerevisiae]|nr:Rts2p [Saccharomyces cerevisiae YJM1399]CAI4751121.1 BCN_G0049590.mRNA.1.CDS.1 [Saccharomyces cerevisiae]CAI4781844.1 BBM_1a_G0049350.mRNA.1.CDS.1 [Saccharomyces cerevisiae]CAI4787682.1 BCE_3a_G0049700.mRNA.1.CDS.1 [Saccharomyces cerevisiae]CAI4790427.1 ADE_G0049240.mRNA.1.CDS.1 [Saccharomyces cerevisiae]